MQETLIYVVMKRLHSIINTAKAFESNDDAQLYARTANFDQTDEAEYYVEKCFLSRKQK